MLVLVGLLFGAAMGYGFGRLQQQDEQKWFTGYRARVRQDFEAEMKMVRQEYQERFDALESVYRRMETIAGKAINQPKEITQEHAELLDQYQQLQAQHEQALLIATAVAV